MDKKTLDKLEKICEPHGVEIDVYSEPHKKNEIFWSIHFFAPEGIHWNASGCNAVAFKNANSFEGIIGFIKEEIKEGFYKAEEGEE